ncbi:MAG: hypothetical protein Q7S33_04820 [Nanoarchaeota archaeon]|nr:hypothetical protein [Nanoarchaeota archaeon]
MNKKKEEYYLAHPFDSRKQIRDWELGFEKRTGISLLNPFYDDSRRTDVEKIDAGRNERYEKLDEKELVERDIGHIKQKSVKGIIAFVNGDLSYGTIQEMVYAKSYNKLVYSVISNGHENHPWLKYHSTKIFKSKDELETFLTSARKD